MQRGLLGYWCGYNKGFMCAEPATPQECDAIQARYEKALNPKPLTLNRHAPRVRRHSSQVCIKSKPLTLNRHAPRVRRPSSQVC
jgi:hypothetical protein